MMPREIEATVATEKPTSPTINAQAPKVANKGRPFGIRLKSPRRKLCNASIRMTEIAAIATIVPVTMLLTLRSAM